MSAPTKTLLEALGAETAATPADVARLRERLPTDLASLRGAPQALSLLDEGAAAPMAPTPSRRRWRAIGAAAALAAAAGVALAVWPAAGPTTEPLQVDLGALGALGQVDRDGLRLTVDGVGTLEGTDAEPRVQWEHGTVRLEVDPAAGRSVVVQTADGEVAVLGTVFWVTRDALGTQVTVERGRVALDCADGARHALAVGEAGACLPFTPGGLLGRARALDAAGADPAAVLEALDSGRDLAAPDTPMSAELSWRRLAPLVALDRAPEAVAAGLAYLDAGHDLHRATVAGQTAALAVAAGDCASARQAAAALAPGDPAPSLGSCAAPPR